MKIKYCLLATNMNENYHEFIPYVCKMWKELLDVEVKIIFVADIIPEKYDQYKNNVILFKPLENIHTAFQAQCLRLLYPCLFDTHEGVMIADIDMIPLQKKYYEGLYEIDKDKFIITHKIMLARKQLMMSGNLAIPSTWKEIFKINDINDIKNTLIKWNLMYPNYDGIRGGVSWNADQEILYNYVTEWNVVSKRLHVYERKNKQFKEMRFKMKLLNRSKNESDMLNFLNEIMDPDFSYIQLCKPFEKYKYFLEWLGQKVLEKNN